MLDNIVHSQSSCKVHCLQVYWLLSSEAKLHYTHIGKSEMMKHLAQLGVMTSTHFVKETEKAALSEMDNCDYTITSSVTTLQQPMSKIPSTSWNMLQKCSWGDQCEGNQRDKASHWHEPLTWCLIWMVRGCWTLPQTYHGRQPEMPHIKTTMLTDHSSWCKVTWTCSSTLLCNLVTSRTRTTLKILDFRRFGNKESVCRILQHLRWKFVSDGLLSSVLMVGDEQTFKTFQKLFQGPEKLWVFKSAFESLLKHGCWDHWLEEMIIQEKPVKRRKSHQL